MSLQRLLHDGTLHTASAAVNEPHLPQTCRMRFVQVLLDDGRDVSRCERMQIELAFDGNPERILIVGHVLVGRRQPRIAAALS